MIVIFIENQDQSIKFVKKFPNNLMDYWKIETNEDYFLFINHLEKKYDVELDFYGEGNEVGYIIESDDEELIKDVFEEFYNYIKDHL
jgi:hypothetical protein